MKQGICLMQIEPGEATRFTCSEHFDVLKDTFVHTRESSTIFQLLCSTLALVEIASSDSQTKEKPQLGVVGWVGKDLLCSASL